MRHSWITRIVLVLGSVVLTLGLFEGFARVLDLGPLRDGLSDLHTPSLESPWLYELIPGARSLDGTVEYAIAEHGFRDRPRTLAKTDGVSRIAVLGDSIAFGYGVQLDQAFPAQLEARLGDRLPVEVLNFGVGGYNSYNEAALLAGRVVDYQPDLVLIQFCVNDLNDPTTHFDHHTRWSLGELPEAAYPDPRTRLLSPLGRWLGACGDWKLCALLDAARIRWFMDEDTRVARYVPLDHLDGRVEAGWLLERYGEMAEAAAGVGARVVVVAFPYRRQLWGEGQGRLQRQLVALSRGRDWEVVNLLPFYRQARAHGARPLFSDFWHPSAEGHRLAAWYVAHELEKRGLVRAAPSRQSPVSHLSPPPTEPIP
ncbi:SGNH/GDSL hydrolase family protein [Myxococcota bacterium]|nr:SGNH/GDSL hydrolase family protein [Myxococcota bacterium]